MDIFHQDTLVLEHITLGLEVELMVQMSINLATFTVLAQQTTQHTHSAHPKDGSRHTGISGTATLTSSSVTAKTLSSSLFTDTETGVRGFGLFYDQTVLGEFTNVLT